MKNTVVYRVSVGYGRGDCGIGGADAHDFDAYADAREFFNAFNLKRGFMINRSKDAEAGDKAMYAFLEKVEYDKNGEIVDASGIDYKEYGTKDYEAERAEFGYLLL